MAVAEFDIITRYFAQPSLAFATDDVVLGIGDDCALLSLSEGLQLAVSTDMLQQNIHFPANADPFLLAQRCLLVNLSDLAAMGAKPVGFFLALSLPSVDADWLQRFSAGLTVVARANNCPLLGGDTTRGPLTICITVQGSVPGGQALRRDGALVGDLVCVTGSLGDAAAALQMLQGNPAGQVIEGTQREALLAAFYQPESRIEAGQLLRGAATAAIDVSDGLAADLQHILRASNTGARIQVDKLPMSEAFCAYVAPEHRLQLALGGGDDYELCFTVPAEDYASVVSKLKRHGTPVTCIGEISAEPGLYWCDQHNKALPLDIKGYQHFS